MSTTLYSQSQPSSPAVAREESASKFLGLLLFVLGVVLPAISFSRDRDLSGQLSDRVAVVDLMCVVLLLMLLLAGRLRVHWTLMLYAMALGIGFALGLAKAPQVSTLTSAAALVMAAMYVILGMSIARSPMLVRALLMGIIVGVMWEAVVVTHDYFLPNWFLDRHLSRVRGTFKASGQLAQYGYGMAGILLTFGWAMFQRRSARLMVLLAGGFAAFFVVAASRRSGMFALAAWLSLYLILGLRDVSRRAYMGMLVLTLVGLMTVWGFSDRLPTSYLATRTLSALDSLSEGESFTQMQLRSALAQIEKWFPLGVGVGQGHTVTGTIPGDTTGEIHNGHLALLVEIGVLGLLTFYVLGMRGIFRPWNQPFGTHATTVKSAAIAYCLAAALFMLHNRLHRDRAFTLFLGLVPTVAAAGLASQSRRGQPAPPGQRVVYVMRRPKA